MSASAPAPASAPPRPPSDSDEAVAAEWAWRERTLSESNTLTGGTGLLHTQHAQTGSQGQFRIDLLGEWFSSGFLCTSAFPCRNPNGGPALTTDHLNHTGGTLSLGVSLFKTRGGAIDLYSSIATFANSDTANKPGLLQVLGDTNLGLKYMASKGSYMSFGGFAELWLINGTGSVGLDGGGTSAKLGIIGTLDLRGTVVSSVHLPVRVSLNASYEFDNTGQVLASTEAIRGEPVTRIERYGLGVNRVDHFDFLLGGEAFFVDERVRPFVEGHLLIASNRQGFKCDAANPSKDNCLETDTLTPATLTVGVRLFPWKRGFSLLAAADIGLSSHDFIEELQPLPPWVVFAGAGWSVDTRDRPVRAQKACAEKVAPRGHVVGFVHERDNKEPIVGAIASYREHADLSPLATGPDGRFWDEVEPGAYSYEVKAEGYSVGSCDATVPALGTAAGVSVDCPLDALPRAGSIVGHVRDADTSQPVAGCPIVVSDGQNKLLQNTDASGAFHFDGVTPGTPNVTVEADGYLVQVVPLEVRAHHESAVDLMLRPLPKQPKVVVTAHEIAIKEQIQFALDSAVILPDSYGILTEIADTFLRHPEIKRAEVQGHTDNTGSPEHNRKLSEARAEAVRAWIVQHGVETGRLVAHGYGPDKPLVPNVTAANRSQNRRVQLIIQERDSSVPEPKGDGSTPPAGKNGGGSAPPAPKNGGGNKKKASDEQKSEDSAQKPGLGF